MEEIRHRHHKRTDSAEEGEGVVHTEDSVEGDGDFDHASVPNISILPEVR